MKKNESFQAALTWIMLSNWLQRTVWWKCCKTTFSNSQALSCKTLCLLPTIPTQMPQLQWKCKKNLLAKTRIDFDRSVQCFYFCMILQLFLFANKLQNLRENSAFLNLLKMSASVVCAARRFAADYSFWAEKQNLFFASDRWSWPK